MLPLTAPAGNNNFYIKINVKCGCSIRNFQYSGAQAKRFYGLCGDTAYPDLS